ncbi:Uncharacterised protein [uncultured archaeon]|nr:Uncharacterised protein [uncultured archaeon]
MQEKIEGQKQRPPSRIRYELTHPVVSFRTSLDAYNELMTYLNKHALSIGDFFRISLKKQKINYEQARNEAFNNGYNNGRTKGYNEGHNKGYDEGYIKGMKEGSKKGHQEGYNEAKQKYCIWFYCAICNEPILITTFSEMHVFVNDFLRREGWGHSMCHQRYR